MSCSLSSFRAAHANPSSLTWRLHAYSVGEDSGEPYCLGLSAS